MLTDLERSEKLAEAFDTIVETYYAENPDFEQITGEHETALNCLFEFCFPFGETDDGRTYKDIIKKPEQCLANHLPNTGTAD